MFSSIWAKSISLRPSSSSSLMRSLILLLVLLVLRSKLSALPSVQRVDRYLIFSPYGGVSNWLGGLRKAACIAERSNRTLVIPPLYNDHHPNGSVFEFIRRNVSMQGDLVLLTDSPATSSRWFFDWSAPTPFVYYEDSPLLGQIVLCHDWTGLSEEVLHMRLKSRERISVLCLQKAWHLRYCMLPEAFIRHSLRITEEARRIIHSQFGSAPFAAAHFRVGDFKRACKAWNASNCYFTVPLMIATLKGLMSSWRVRRAWISYDTTDASEAARIQQEALFSSFNPLDTLTVTVRNERALLDQEICSRANFFIGNPFSSFSGRINQLRRQRGYHPGSSLFWNSNLTQ